MPNIPLFTSIPARVSRRLPDGREVGAAWTRACIASWQRAGYDVVSVNAASESAEVRARHPDIEVVEVGRDGQAASGRPLVYVADLLAAMARSGQRSVALANADVMCMNDATALLRGWEPEGFAFSNRLDVDDPGGANPRLHGGVDFLIVNTRHLQNLAAPDFLFGTPWWDYWLPLALMARGAPGRRLALNGLPVVAHLAHPERWNRADFIGNFERFSRALADAAVQPDANDASGAPDAMLALSLHIARSTSGMIHQLNGVLDLTGVRAMAAAP
jgi:hypothetical protein